MPRSLFAVGLFLLGAPLAVYAAEEPTFAGRKKSEWLKILKEDKSPRQREGAVAAMSLMEPRDRAMVDAVADALLTDKAERVRLGAVAAADLIMRTSKREESTLADAIGKSLTTETVEAIRLKILEMIKQQAKEYLQRLAPVLADVLKDDKSVEVRVAASVALSRTGERAKTVLNGMIVALKDKEPAVRAAVAEAIGRIGFEAKDAVTPLRPLLKDPDSGVRLAAAFALGRIGPDSSVAVPELAAVLGSDSEANVRKECARAFSLLGLDAKAAVPALAKALREDKSEEVRQHAAIALGKMHGATSAVAAVMVDVMKKDKDKTVRVFVTHALGDSLGDGLRAYVKDLAEQLIKDQEGDVRLAIVQELGALGPAAKDALPALNRAVADVQLSVRDEAKKAVKKVMAQ
jgi:HEAT repeat protein